MPARSYSNSTNISAGPGATADLAYRPFLRTLDQRTERIQRGLAEVAEAERVWAEIEKAREEVLSAAREEVRRLLEEASLGAREEVDQGRIQGRQEAQACLRRAHQQAEACRELVFLAAEKALGQVIDQQAHRQAMEAASPEILALGWPYPLPASVRFGRGVSPQPLTAKEFSAIQRGVAEMVGCPLYLHASTNPRLLGGLLLSFGDSVVDASVAGRPNRLYHHQEF